jgi:hypothetical protein
MTKKWHLGDIAYEFGFWSNKEYYVRRSTVHSFKEGTVFIKMDQELFNSSIYKCPDPGTLVRVDFDDLKTPKMIFSEIMEYGSLKVLLKVMKLIATSHREIIVWLFTLGLEKLEI